MNRLWIDFYKESDASHGRLGEQVRLLFEQLGALSHISDLAVSLTENTNRIQRTAGLELRLDQGLAALEPLRKLRKIRWHDSLQLSTYDVTWMLEHWPDLYTFAGALNLDLRKATMLCYMFCERGVRIDDAV